MDKENKKWRVTYAHDDGRSGTIEVETEVGKSAAFQYGNGKYGVLIVGDFEQGYDLRYSSAKNLHMVMLEEYFGKGLVTAEEIERK